MLLNTRPGGVIVTELVLVLAILITAYVVSLKLNPYVRCSRCKGNPRRRAWLFRNAQHVCTKCQGTGAQLRFGRRLVFGEPESPGER
jgi:DnaJ-class molecular chaperone